MTRHAAPLPPSPDELAVQYEGLAAKVAQRNVHRLSPAAADFDDLKSVAWVAIWQAARSYDGRIPWGLYAELVARRAVNDFIRVQRRRGLTWVGDKGREKREAPTTVGLGDWDCRVPDRDAPAVAEVQELLDRLAAASDWVEPRALEVVELVVRHGLTQARIARRLGVTRQRVGQLLAPIRRFLRE